jgi:DNA-binding transcriptional ArsR family regulator
MAVDGIRADPAGGGLLRAGRGAATRRSRGTGRKRSPDEVDALAEEALRFLATHPGEFAVSSIAVALDVPTADLSLPLQRLRKSGRVRTSGQKRSTVYRVDEPGPTE